MTMPRIPQSIIGFVAAGITLAMLCQAAAARVFQAAPHIGMINRYTIKPGDSLIELARNFDLGFNEIADANPSVDPFIPPPGIDIELPLAWLVPRVPSQEGIIVNLAEMRLYFLRTGQKPMIETFPVGIGESGKDTPMGIFSVIEKMVDPVWHVPASIRAERPELQPVVASGQDNPLGTHALRLSIGDVLIHGTNKPWGQGRRVSHGCIRLYPEDIRKFYLNVPIGTTVTIICQPVKVRARNGRIFVEVHRWDNTDYISDALGQLRQQDLLQKTDMVKLKVAIYQKKGVPVDVTAH